MKFAFLSVTYSGQFYNGPALTVLEQIRKGSTGCRLRPSVPSRRRSI
jgi:hypothetical protein